jgi:hypothetical protein
VIAAWPKGWLHERVARSIRITMDAETLPIGHKLIKDATLINFEILKTEVEPTADQEDKVVTIELQLEEEMIDTCALGFMFALGVLSFHDGRPRGVSGHWFEDDDELSIDDFLLHLTYRRGALCVYFDYIRGRCLKTTVEVSPDGKLYMQTVNRGEAATRWVDKLRGKKFLRPTN